MEVAVSKVGSEVNVSSYNFIAGEYEDITRSCIIVIKGSYCSAEFVPSGLSKGPTTIETHIDLEDRDEENSESSEDMGKPLTLTITNLDNLCATKVDNSTYNIEGPISVKLEFEIYRSDWKIDILFNKLSTDQYYVYELNDCRPTDLYDSEFKPPKTELPEYGSKFEPIKHESSDQDSDEDSEYESESSSESESEYLRHISDILVASEYRKELEECKYLSYATSIKTQHLIENMLIIQIMGATFIVGTMLMMLAAVIFRLA